MPTLLRQCKQIDGQAHRETNRQTETKTHPAEDAYIRRSDVLHHKW